MKRVKTLGLLACMALALTAAIGAPSASAAGFVVNGWENPTTLKAESGSFNFPVGMEGTLSCSTPSFSSAIEPIENKVTTESAAFAGCGTGSVKTNGCQFTFDPRTRASAEKFNGTIAIGGPSCTGLTVQKGLCTVSVPPQSGLTSYYRNTSSTTVSFEAAASLKYVGVSGPGSCKSGTENTGSWTGYWTTKALNKSGKQLELSATDLGIYLNGKAGGEPQPRFEAYRYWEAFESESPTTFTFTTERKITCTATKMSGVLLEPSPLLILNPTYSGCTSGGGVVPVDVTVNYCNNTLSTLNAGPPYVGTFGIECETGAQLEFKLYSSDHKTLYCTFKLGSQSGLEGVGLANGAEEGTAEINASVSGVTYERIGTGLACGKIGGGGVASDGTISYSTTLGRM